MRAKNTTPNVNVSAVRLNLVFRRKDIRVIPTPTTVNYSLFPSSLSFISPLPSPCKVETKCKRSPLRRFIVAHLAVGLPISRSRSRSRCSAADMFLSTLSYLGGFGTFGQVLLALPMALDLLGAHTHSIYQPLHPSLLTRRRSSVLLTPLAAVHAAPLPLFHSPSRPEKHPSRPAHLLPLVHLPAHLIPLHPSHTVLPPPPSLRAAHYGAPALPGAPARQRPAVPVCGGAQMGITPLHAPRGDQHAVGHSGRGARRQGMGRRGGEGGRCRVERYRRPRCGCFGVLGRSRGGGHGEWHALLLTILRGRVQCASRAGRPDRWNTSCCGHFRQRKR